MSQLHEEVQPSKYYLWPGSSSSWPLRSYMNEDELFKLINNIPEKNKTKFVFDLMYLLHLAQGDDYENFDITK